jgi:hypothetical protein
MAGLNGHENGYIQPILEGLSTPEAFETELDNCLVLTRPTYTDTGKKQEWTCSLHALPSLFHPDENTVYFAHATGAQAKRARRSSLKPGDRVWVKGIVETDTITYPTGDVHTFHAITLTEAPIITAKETRVSTTVFEQRQAKRNGYRS